MQCAENEKVIFERQNAFEEAQAVPIATFNTGVWVVICINIIP